MTDQPPDETGRHRSVRGGRHARDRDDAEIAPPDFVARRPPREPLNIGSDAADESGLDQPSEPAEPEADRARPNSAIGLAGVGTGVQQGRGNRRPVGQNIARVGLALSIAFGALAAGAGYWQVIEASPLSTAPDNPAVVAAARRATRGDMVDRTGTW